jgi:hypothetical protein
MRSEAEDRGQTIDTETQKSESPSLGDLGLGEALRHWMAMEVYPTPRLLGETGDVRPDVEANSTNLIFTDAEESVPLCDLVKGIAIAIDLPNEYALGNPHWLQNLTHFVFDFSKRV